MDRAVRLQLIYDDVDHRSETITAARPWWPCAPGCDHCCRALAELPRFTAAEWARLRQSLDRWTVHALGEVSAAVDDAVNPHAPAAARRTCPLLDREHGRCRVYEDRPAACRTYGFYASRSRDLWCEHIDRALTRHPHDADPTWGNQSAVETRLRQLSGPERSLAAWWSDDPPTGVP